MQSLERLKIKKVVEKEIVKAIWSWIYYFSKVNGLFEDGKLGLEDSPFSSGSPIKILRRLLGEIERLMPHLKEVTSKRVYAEISASVEIQVETVTSIIATYEQYGLIIDDETTSRI